MILYTHDAAPHPSPSFLPSQPHSTAEAISLALADRHDGDHRIALAGVADPQTDATGLTL